MTGRHNKAVFLDRDGTINVEKNYLYKIEDFEYLEGVKEGLKILQQAGYLLIIVTNQSGIARGYYTESDYHRLNKWMLGDLAKDGIYITDSYYCPHHPDAIVKKYKKICGCRKPATELFMRAVKEYNINLEKSYAMGDKLRDLTLCGANDRKDGIQGYLLYAEKGERENMHCIRGGILEAARCIVERENGTVDKRDHKR